VLCYLYLVDSICSTAVYYDGVNRRLIVDVPRYITLIKMTSKNKSNSRNDPMESLDESGGEDEGNNNLQKLIFEDKYLTKYQDDKGVRKWRYG
jgi:hypothetical protein